MLLFKIKSPNALLERQKTLIDLCTFRTRLFIVICGVGSSLATRQIDEAHSGVYLVVTSSFKLHLEHSVRSRRGIVSTCGSAGPLLKAIANKLHDILDRLDGYLGESTYIDLLLIILKALDLLFLIK